ncbi:MAG: CRISPR-associated protein Cas2 [Spirochaetales bacterium]|nr:CRISPR-associated protein Cas2 [Spirochaetales bacterium]
MFVSVIIDAGGEDSSRVTASLLHRYGFTQVQGNCFESYNMNEKQLARLKLDLDRATDFYDAIRFYQYPVDDRLVISSLTENRWRRMILKEKNSAQ